MKSIFSVVVALFLACVADAAQPCRNGACRLKPTPDRISTPAVATKSACRCKANCPCRKAVRRPVRNFLKSLRCR